LADATPAGDRFRGLVLVLRGRASLTQRALATHLGISEEAIRRWEGEEGYPSPARLQALIALYLERGVFTAGREAQEATALWEALRREAAQCTPAFDAAWFASRRPAAPEVPASPPPLPAGASTAAPERSQWQAWREAHAVGGFQGRQAEATALRRWLLEVPREPRCLLVLDNLETVLEPGGDWWQGGSGGLRRLSCWQARTRYAGRSTRSSN
jgi:transcriptional regulator with XRE-family HTH domain